MARVVGVVLLLALLLLSCAVAPRGAAGQQVLGVDMGSESVRVAAPRGAAGIDLVLNEYSRRKTDNYVAHHHGDWYVGDHAKTLAARFPLRSAGAVNLLVGAHDDKSNSVDEDDDNNNNNNTHTPSSIAWHYTSRVAYDSTRGAAQVTFRDTTATATTPVDATATAATTHEADDMTLAAEELYAMLLAYTRKMAQHDGVAGSAHAAAAAVTAAVPTSMVLTLPSYASMRERRAVLDAAAIAQVRVHALLPSTTAAALYYGTRRRGIANATLHLLVLDVGATHVEAGVYTLSPPPSSSSSVVHDLATRSRTPARVPLGEAFGTLTTVALLHNRSLGGRALDLCVARLIEREAMHALGIDAVLPPNDSNNNNSNNDDDNNAGSVRATTASTTAVLKARFALLRAANRARETLSVNRATPYTVEGIAPGRDYHGTLTRDAYERACGALIDGVADVARRARALARARGLRVDAFELVGGAARTPGVIAAVAAALDGEVSRTLNMEEAAAYGAGYYAVKLSPHYRARGFRVVAPAPHAVYFTVHPPRRPHEKRSNNDNNDNNSSTARAHYRRLLVNDTTTLLGDVLSVTVARDDDFVLALYDGKATDNTSSSSSSRHFADVYVTGVREALQELAAHGSNNSSNNTTHIVRVQMQLTEAGVLDVTEAVVVMRYYEAVTRRGNTHSGRDNNDDDEHARDANASTQTGSDVTDSNNNDDDDDDSDDDAADDSNSSNKTAVSSPRLRRRTRAVALTTYMEWRAPRAMSATALTRAQQRLRAVAAHEARKHARAQAKNSLEAYLFWLRYDDAHAATMARADAPAALTTRLRLRTTDAQQWLEDGRGSEDDCGIDEYQQRLRELQTLVEELQQVLADDQATTTTTITNTTAATAANDNNGGGGDAAPTAADDDVDDDL